MNKANKEYIYIEQEVKEFTKQLKYSNPNS